MNTKARMLVLISGVIVAVFVVMTAIQQEAGEISSDSIALDAPIDSAAAVIQLPVVVADHPVDLLIQRAKPSEHYFIDGSVGTYLRLASGNLGSVDVASIEAHDPASIQALFSSYQVFHGFDENISLTILSVGHNDGTYTVDFRQDIGGIPVNKTQKIVFDQRGKVTWLAATIVDPLSVQQHQVQLDEAIVHATQAVKNHVGQADVQTSVSPISPSHLVYDVSDLNSVPRPIWEISMRTVPGAPDYHVQVDANTGETNVLSTAYFVDLRLCEDIDASLGICEDGPVIHDPETGEEIDMSSTGWPQEVREVFIENADGDQVCLDPNNACNDMMNTNPWKVVEQLEEMLEEEASTVCCDQVGGYDNRIDIMTNRRNSSSPYYASDTDAIIIPGDPPAPGSGVDPNIDFSQVDDAIAHEAAHAVICANNRDLCENYGEFSSVAIIEGMADAVTGVYSERYGAEGEDWVMMENVYSDPENPRIRDMRVPREWNDIVTIGVIDGLPDPHVAGMVYSHVFYRLSQSGISRIFVTRIIIDTAARLQREGGYADDIYDPGDFEAAIYAAAYAMGSDVILDKVDEILFEMNNGVGSYSDDSDEDYECEDCEEYGESDDEWEEDYEEWEEEQ